MYPYNGMQGHNLLQEPPYGTKHITTFMYSEPKIGEQFSNRLGNLNDPLSPSNAHQAGLPFLSSLHAAGLFLIGCLSQPHQVCGIMRLSIGDYFTQIEAQRTPATAFSSISRYQNNHYKQLRHFCSQKWSVY